MGRYVLNFVQNVSPPTIRKIINDFWKFRHFHSLNKWILLIVLPHATDIIFTDDEFYQFSEIV